MAKKTLGDCIDEARTILQDKVEPYRYSDAELASIFTNACYEIKRLRPDAYIGGYGVDLTIYTDGDLALEVPFPSTMFQPVVLFMAGFAELRDDEFTVDNRAGTLLRSFAGQLVAQGGVV